MSDFGRSLPVVTTTYAAQAECKRMVNWMQLTGQSPGKLKKSPGKVFVTAGGAVREAYCCFAE